jgi:hypothetical protein
MPAGTITRVEDHGSVCLVYIDTEKGMPLAADGNLLRRLNESNGPLVGLDIEYDMTNWGGLASLSLPDPVQNW